MTYAPIISEIETVTGSIKFNTAIQFNESMKVNNCPGQIAKFKTQ